MSDTPRLPETIWWCEKHEWPALMSTYCGRPNPQMCRMVELRVAGRDDLLIRREADGNIDRIGSDLSNWSPRQPERIQDFARARRQWPGRFAPWERDIGFLIAFYEAALAAAEGEETE